MDSAHKVLGRGSEQGPVGDLWEPEDPQVPKQRRAYGPLAKRDGGGLSDGHALHHTPFLLSCEFGAKLQSGYD